VKWIGQHIVDFIARFRSDVYLEDISTGTIASGGNLGLDSNNKIVKADEDGDTTYSVQDGELSQNNFTNDDHTKLNGIEASADVTDATNVTAAGALMDSEVDADIKTLSLPASTTISTYGASLVDDADAAAARTTLGLGTGAVLATAAISNGGVGLATADQIHTFVTTQTDATDANTSGQAGTVATIAGLAPNTATTQATQAAITTCANLTTTGTIGTGTWEGTDVGVAHGGTGLSTVAANTMLTGNGTSALTAEANLTFSGDRLIIGANTEISPHVRFLNDENTINMGVTSTSDGILAGSADGDFAINCTGDHNVLFGQNNAIAAKIDTDGDFNLNRKFTITADADASYEGDVVYFGGTTSMVKGRIYHYKSDGTWEAANANAVATSDGLLGVALGAASDTNGMLLRGMVTLDHDPGAVGDVLYLDEQQVASAYGAATSGAPAGNNNIVRVIGYCLDVSKGKIWFNPDNTFVEVTA
jgi:hypothetical protein